MPKICFSFDDSVTDTYTLAFPILKKFNMPFTINAITKPIENNSSAYMTVEQLKECYNYGAEIACHGHTHQNNRQDVLDNIEFLKKHNLFNDSVGFASPCSEITLNNGEEIKALVRNGELSYIRSGICVRREGLLYSALSYIERRTHSKGLFYILNKRNIIKSFNRELLTSVAITKYTTVSQIMYLLNKLKDDECVILMFHHLTKSENLKSENTWMYKEKDFYKLCECISNKNIDVVTTMEIVNG